VPLAVTDDGVDALTAGDLVVTCSTTHVGGDQERHGCRRDVAVSVGRFGRSVDELDAQFTEIPRSYALLINTVAIAMQLAIIPVMGWASDTLLRRKSWLLISVVGLAILGLPAFILLHQSNFLWIWVAQILLAILISPLLGISPAMMVELFPTETRLSAYSISFNLGVSLVGGTSLLVCTWLINISNNVYAPALYLVVSALMALTGLVFMGDRSREPLM
ncbi:MAG: MFS transporter, partial [Moorea sp. SIO3C2]|nr:MFS transporter [Moorena sp. SIO3C2]